MSKTRFVAFATQKGGIGKSTITALVANYFHNVKGYNVAVIDCDEPQYNLADLRDEELELIKSSDYFKAQACEHFKKLGKKSFSVTRSNAVNALDDAETVLNETEVKLYRLISHRFVFVTSFSVFSIRTSGTVHPKY